jgi:hypothetical protein
VAAAEVGEPHGRAGVIGDFEVGGGSAGGQHAGSLAGGRQPAEPATMGGWAHGPSSSDTSSA